METKKREVSFPIKTRIPKDSNVVQISNVNYYGALEMGRHLSTNTKIINANEIVRLRNASIHRLRVKDLAFRTVWNGITTGSTEYLGYNKKNELIIVWLPNIGPLQENIDSFKPNYSESSSDSWNSLGKIPRSIFLEILDGKFGEFTALNVMDLREEIEKNGMRKLLLARLGGLLNKESLDQANKYLNNLVSPPKSDLSLYFHSTGSRTWLLSELNSFATAGFIELSEVEEGEIPHIGISGSNLNHGFLFGLDNNKPHVRKFLPNISEGEYKWDRNLPKCFITNTNPLEIRHQQIQSFNHWYFTLREKIPVANGYFYGSPECLVISMKIVSERRIADVGTTPTLLQIESLVNTEWNFYELQRRRRDKKDFWDITYYQGYVDESRIIPTEAEILASPKLLGRIV